jgi:ankyrin repeat protein
MKAAERSNLEVIEVLLERGADINAASSKVTQTR